MVKVNAYLDVNIGTEKAGRIVIELFHEDCPITVDNFLSICCGNRGVALRSRKPMHYMGCKFFRIIPGLIVQSGDFELNNGDGGESIYGGEFNDESFARKHSHAGIVSMANKGKNSNGSQFFITLRSAPQFDGKHVAFGQVIMGMEVLRMMEKIPVDQRFSPKVTVIITGSGKVDSMLPKTPTEKRILGQRAHIEALHSHYGTEPNFDTDQLPITEMKPPQTAAEKAKENLTKLLEFHRSSEKRSSEKRSSEKKNTDTTISKIKPIGEDQIGQDQIGQDQIGQDQIGENQTDGSQELNETGSCTDDYLRQLSKNNPAAKKLLNLKLKLNQSRTMNRKELLLEKRKELNPHLHHITDEDLLKTAANAAKGDTEGCNSKSNDMNNSTKASSILHGNKNDPLNEPASQVISRNKKILNKSDQFGWDVFNLDAYYNAHEKRIGETPFLIDYYQRQKEELGDSFYETKKLITHKPDQYAENRLVDSILKQATKRNKFSRKRAQYDEETVSYINRRNRMFNKKLEKSFEEYSIEIKKNLERGTAL